MPSVAKQYAGTSIRDHKPCLLLSIRDTQLTGSLIDKMHYNLVGRSICAAPGALASFPYLGSPSHCARFRPSILSQHTHYLQTMANATRELAPGAEYGRMAFDVFLMVSILLHV